MQYSSWHGKKLQSLARREAELMAALQKGAELAKVRAYAEEVRAAQIRVLRSKQAEFPPSEKNDVALRKLDVEIGIWSSLGLGEVIEGYRSGKYCAQKPKRPRLTRKGAL